MAPLKSPGPNGFSACFYQKYWMLVGDEVCIIVLNFLNGGSFNDRINYNYIVFIPKVKNSVNVRDFRPISLCNVIYKLISKVLSNRLKKILPIIISPNQSAFILVSLIIDNVIVAYETLHFMKTRHKGKDGDMTLKLDISKAYDRIE